MRNSKMISESLNNKIMENEKRMKKLRLQKELLPKYRQSFQTLTKITSDQKQKIERRKNKSQEEIRPIKLNNPKKLIIHFSDIQIDDHNEKPTNIKLDKAIKTQNNPKKEKQKEKPKEKPKEKKLNENKNVKNNEINNESTNTNSKKVNKEQIDVIVNRLYNNNNKRIKIEIEKGDNNDYNDTKKSKVNLSEFYSRFEDDIKRRNENLEKKREQMENLYTYKPILRINKKFFDEQNNEDFFERQKNYLEEKEHRKEKYKENLLKKENDKINGSNILLKNNKRSKKNIIKTINDMVDWEKKRQKRLENKQKEKEEKLLNEFTYTPKINKKSESLAKNKNRKNADFLQRLSENDKVIKEKRKILTQLYTPTFEPNVMLRRMKYKNLHSKKEKEFRSISQRFKSGIFENNFDLNFNHENPEVKLNKYESNDLEEEDIQNAFRKTLFHKDKK